MDVEVFWVVDGILTIRCAFFTAIVVSAAARISLLPSSTYSASRFEAAELVDK